MNDDGYLGVFEAEREALRERYDNQPPAATYDYVDEAGALLFQVLRFEPKRFEMRRPDGNGWVSGAKGARMVPYHLDELVAARAVQNGEVPRIYICEGEKDVDRLRDDWGLVATCNPMGAGKWRGEYNEHFAGAEVVILSDNDEAGREHAQAIAAELAPLAAGVKIIDLGGLAGADISDWMDFGALQSDLADLVDTTAPWLPPPPPPPIINVVSGSRHIAADEGIAALLAARVPFYQRNGALQRVAEVKAKNAGGEIMTVPGIISVDHAMMSRELGRSAIWQRFDLRQNKHRRIDPPSDVAGQILSMAGFWPFAPLRGIIQCPTLRHDGSLLNTPGYDEATGLILTSGVQMPPLPVPTRAAAKAALKLLNRLLDEFPFIDAPSRAVALSMLITPVIRGAMPVAPMHLVTAPLPGSGKSYLADIASMIATGQRCPVKAAAPNYEETEKRLIGSALEGRPIITLDNHSDLVAGDFLCQLIERPLLELRRLGSSDPILVSNAFSVFVNGNNAGVAEDLVRRTIRSGLDANMEHPEKRAFKSNPLATVADDRGKYVAACLTIPLAYLFSGALQPTNPLLSFENWSQLVRNPLIWLGCGDPVDTQETLTKGDPRKAEQAAIFTAWKSSIGVGKNKRHSTKELIDAIESNYPELREAFFSVAPRRLSIERKIDPKALGKWLSKHEGTIAAECKLHVDRTDASRPRWFLNLL